MNGNTAPKTVCVLLLLVALGLGLEAGYIRGVSVASKRLQANIEREVKAFNKKFYCDQHDWVDGEFECTILKLRYNPTIPKLRLPLKPCAQPVK